MFTADWFSQNIKNWEKWLGHLKGKDDLTFMEIGCFEGQATRWLMENILTGVNPLMIVVDTFEGGMEAGEKGAFYTETAEQNFIENLKAFKKNIIMYKGISQEVLRTDDFKGTMTGYDFIYIDGSHRSAEVLEDSIHAFRLLKKGGVMIWDDYGLNRYPDKLQNPKMGIDAFIAIFEGKFEVISKGYQVCIRKNKTQAKHK
jgi:hypothetical protein